MMIRLPHKLWIFPQIVAPQKYQEFLSFFEAVASAPNTLKLIIQNIGKEMFPGGKISEGRINWEATIGMATFTQSRAVAPELPPIQPEETFTLKVENWIPFNPGLLRLRMKITANDSAKIEYYQSLTSPLPEDEWYQFVYAVDRHQLDLVLLLKQSLGERR